MVTPAKGRVFVVRHSFSYFDDSGVPHTYNAGQRIRENHPIMDGREQFFKLDTSVIELPETK